MLPFYTLEKNQKTRRFLTFSGDLKIKNWYQIGYIFLSLKAVLKAVEHPHYPFSLNLVEQPQQIGTLNMCLGTRITHYYNLTYALKSKRRT